MRNSLPRKFYAATQRIMRERLTSLLVMMALFFGVAVMPAIAHAGEHGPAHAGEMLDIHDIDEADHSQGADKDMPCHAVSHHHCSVALQLDGPRIAQIGLSKSLLMRPGSTEPLLSRSQAPPLDPPNA
jgi:hypothetical protein